MKSFLKALALATAVFSTPAMAGVGCQGSVNKIITGPDGDFYVDFGYNRLKICNIDGTTAVDRGTGGGGTASITPGRCQALYASFMTAKSSGRPLIAYVDRADCNFTDGALPTPYLYAFYFLN